LGAETFNSVLLFPSITYMKEKVAETTLRQKIGENAYEYTKENLSWTVYARNMEIIFQKAINSFQTAS